MTNDESVDCVEDGKHGGATNEVPSKDGMLTLQRLRTGGNQTVTVQHVNVQPGGQAVIGNVQARPGVGGAIGEQWEIEEIPRSYGTRHGAALTHVLRGGRADPRR